MINTIKKINDDKFTMPVFKIQETIITTTFFLTLFYFALSHLQLLSWAFRVIQTTQKIKDQDTLSEMHGVY